MLDRLISGAGAVTDAADRAVRLLVGGWRGGLRDDAPGSVVVAGLLLVLAGILVAAGLEVTAPTTPVPLDPAGVATARDFGERTYSTMTGSLSTTWIETSRRRQRERHRGRRQTGGRRGSTGSSIPSGGRGVTVRGARSPAEIFTYRGAWDRVRHRRIRRTAPRNTGCSTTRSPERASPVGSRGGARYDDRPVGEPRPGGAGPDRSRRPGTAVELSGARTRRATSRCDSVDSDLGTAAATPTTRIATRSWPWSPATRRGDPGARAASRPHSGDATVTGAPPTRGAGGGRRADEPGFRFHGARSPGSQIATCSTRSRRPAARRWRTSWPRVFLALAGRSSSGWPAATSSTDAPPPRCPPRRRRWARASTSPCGSPASSGRRPVASTSGRCQGELVRFVLGRPVEAVVDVHAADGGVAPAGRWRPPERRSGRTRRDHAARGPRADRGGPGPDGPIATTLHVERDGRPQGVAVGLGEVSRISIGQAMAFRGARPALRILAGTGLVVLSFDTARRPRSGRRGAARRDRSRPP